MLIEIMMILWDITEVITIHMKAVRHGPCQQQYIREYQKEETDAKETIEMSTEKKSAASNQTQGLEVRTRSSSVSRKLEIPCWIDQGLQWQ